MIFNFIIVIVVLTVFNILILTEFCIVKQKLDSIQSRLNQIDEQQNKTNP